MNASRDPKSMAKSLRVVLAQRQIVLSHSECLEIVARQLGFADWNTASASVGKTETAFVQPAGWLITGDDVSNYEVGLDPVRSGQVTILSRAQRSDGFVTLMQTIDASPFRQNRLCLRSDLSTALDSGWAAIWMRIDGFNGKTIRFDNLSKREADGRLVGVQEWVERKIVLDVPDAAETISYGFMMEGIGQSWCKAFSLETVDASVPLTSHAKGMIFVPTNLDFVATA